MIDDLRLLIFDISARSAATGGMTWRCGSVLEILSVDSAETLSRLRLRLL
jgi:hypothetical protein